MKKDKQQSRVSEDKAQTASATKKKPTGKYQPAQKTEAGSSAVNTAKQTPGINQANSKKQDLLPSD